MSAPRPTQAQIDALKTEHGEVYEISNEHASIWIHKNKLKIRGAYREYRKDRSDAERALVANEQLLRSLLVFPEPAQFDAILSEFPAITEDLIEPVLGLFGVTNRATATKS